METQKLGLVHRGLGSRLRATDDYDNGSLARNRYSQPYMARALAKRNHMYEIEILSIRLDGNRQGSLAHDRITSDEGSK